MLHSKHMRSKERRSWDDLVMLNRGFCSLFKHFNRLHVLKWHWLVFGSLFETTCSIQILEYKCKKTFCKK